MASVRHRLLVVVTLFCLHVLTAAVEAPRFHERRRFFNHQSLDDTFERDVRRGTTREGADDAAQYHLVRFDRAVRVHTVDTLCKGTLASTPLLVRRGTQFVSLNGDVPEAGAHTTIMQLFGTTQQINSCLALLRPHGIVSAPGAVQVPGPLHKLHHALLARVVPSVRALDADDGTDAESLHDAPADVMMNASTVLHVVPLHLVAEGVTWKAVVAAVDAILQRTEEPDTHVSTEVRWQDHVSASEGTRSELHGVLPVVVPSGERLNPATLVAIASLPFVRRVERAARYTGQNNVATVTLQSEYAATRPLWAHGLTGANQIAAVGDTGLDFDSCFFDDASQTVAVYPAMNTNHRKVISYVPCTLTNGSKQVGDIRRAHGTHVCGSIAGSSRYFPQRSHEARDAVTRDSAYDGMAKDAKLFFTDLTCGDLASDQSMVLPGDLYDAFEPAYNAGARVSTNSWGDDKAPKEYTAVNRRTDAFAYEHPEMLIAFAAGNVPQDGVISPAAAKNVLTVGAHMNSNDVGQRNTLCSFSARGQTFDGRVKPDVLGPGQPVMSASSDGKPNTYQCELHSLSGTSMACPLVAGSAVLLRQYFTDNYYPAGVAHRGNGLMTAPLGATLKAVLAHASHRLRSATAVPDSNEGFGRLELGGIIYFNDTGAENHLFVDEASVTHGGRMDWCLHTNVSPNPGDVRVTIAWLDPALAAEGSHDSVVNNLDLAVVRVADGALFHGNTDGDSLTTTKTFDHRNVIEKVIVTSPRTGYYTITVWGFHVETALQNFSIVATAPRISVQRGNCSARVRADPPALPALPVPLCPTQQHDGGARNVACSGHGTCRDGLCECQRGYTHVDCSACDAELVCSGNGVCNPSTLKCSCAAHIDTAKAANCATCAIGWFGPHCTFDCQCVHGACDRAGGLCRCDRSASTGYWSGDHCDRCAFDYVRAPILEGGGVLEPVTPLCKRQAYWCLNRATREVVVDPGSRTWFLINENEHYDNSMSCRWRIRSSHATLPVTIAFPCSASSRRSTGFECTTAMWRTTSSWWLLATARARQALPYRGRTEPCWWCSRATSSAISSKALWPSPRRRPAVKARATATVAAGPLTRAFAMPILTRRQTAPRASLVSQGARARRTFPPRRRLRQAHRPRRNPHPHPVLVSRPRPRRRC
jgi:subtilisin family serine protease